MAGGQESRVAKSEDNPAIMLVSRPVGAWLETFEHGIPNAIYPSSTNLARQSVLEGLLITDQTPAPAASTPDAVKPYNTSCSNSRCSHSSAFVQELVAAYLHNMFVTRNLGARKKPRIAKFVRLEIAEKRQT